MRIHPIALYNLYFSGKGVEQSFEKAAEYRTILR